MIKMISSELNKNQAWFKSFQGKYGEKAVKKLEERNDVELQQ